ncbi:hypothetical protein BG015_002365 [Linnemannia schmuckeri]|uniref:Uncharacterized protein n=1 Tax=Linnemannia schmuckeri TaxID=64567 RepID=A0A9P5S5Q1_9FUNG|nr:hypothetical protein BG015_002365 [Linnemannia schmuckeri]
MLPTTIRLAVIAHARTPLIRFLGSRKASPNAHHEAGRHPAAPKDAEYLFKAGTPLSPSSPLKTSAKQPSDVTTTPGPHGATRYTLDFAELPSRYRHPVLTEAEIEAVEMSFKKSV